METYIINTISQLIILLIILARTAFMTSLQPTVLRRCRNLICMTGLYIIADAAFICVFLSEKPQVFLFKLISFFFSVTYVLLPFFWQRFTRSFVGDTFFAITHKLEYIPVVILMALVISTPFTGALWSVTPDGTYVRGPLFIPYSILNLFYYIEPFLYAPVVRLRNNRDKEPYLTQAVLISLVPLAAMAINSFVIPVYVVFPLQPYCAVLVALLGYFFIVARESDLIQEKHRMEIQTALKQAQEATAAAIEASKVKSTFLSTMSHDIRTPMNAIINLTEMALKEDDIGQIRQFLDKIQGSSRFLLGLINDILDMSKIESGEMEFNKSTLTRPELMQTISTVISPLMEAKNIHFHPEIDPGRYTIMVDRLRISQIFFNLLTNAAKFTPEGGDVWFEVTNVGLFDGRLRVKFVVRDTGIGMSPEFVEHMYEPFVREKTRLREKTQGTGLGLSIVKSLVDAMGGTITVKSKQEEGTEFTVMLDMELAEGQEPSETEPAHEQPDACLDGMNILLVEDNEINVYVASLLLEQQGCRITVADDGQKGVDAFAASEPYSIDAILMDVRMPVMNGIEATRIIRAMDRPDAAEVSIIAMTADVFDEERKRTLEAGMNYHLSKPINAEQLYDVLKECRSRKEAKAIQK